MVKFSDIEKVYKSHGNKLEITPPPAIWERVDHTLSKRDKTRLLTIYKVTAAAIIAGLIAGAYVIHILVPRDHYPRVANEQANPPATVGTATTYNPPAGAGDNNPAYREGATVSTGNEPVPIQTILPQTVTTAIDLSIPAPGAGYAFNVNGAFTSPPRRIEPALAQVISPVAGKKEKRKAGTKLKERFNVEQSRYFNDYRPRRVQVSLGGGLAPTYSFRQAYTGGQAGPGVALTIPVESGLRGASGGVNVNLRFGRNWSVESGARFARLGQSLHAQGNNERMLTMNGQANQQDNISMKSISLFNSMGKIAQTSGGPPFISGEHFMANAHPELVIAFAPESEPFSGTVKQMIDYIEVPLTVRYSFFARQVEISVSAGVSTNWLVSNNAYLVEPGNRERIGTTEGIATMSWSSHAGLAFSIPVEGPLSIMIEPRLNYFISDINHQYPGSFKPYSIGIFSGIQYSLGN